MTATRSRGSDVVAGYQHDFFERTAACHPDAPAVDDAGCVTSYAALEARANRIAHLLRETGCGPNSRVVVFTEKTADQYAAVLGTLKAGGCWVPFGAAFPAARCRSLVETLDPVAILTDPVHETAAWAAAEGRDVPVFVLGGTAEAALANRPDTPPADTGLTPEDLAYIIFTSGSTGTPKGVMVRHRNTAFFLERAAEFFDIAPGSRFAHFADLTFDPSVFDLFHAWATGGTVVPAGKRSHRINPAAFLTEARPEILFCVPSAIAAVEEAGRLAACGVRHLLLTGEALPPALVRRWYDAHPDSTVYNMYGTTETAIVSHWYAVPRDMDGQSPVPVGHPLPGMRVRLLDADDMPVAPGVPGESVVSGPQVSPGYWANGFLTAKNFGPDPQAGGAPVTVYRTGDLLRADADGLHHFAGRRDDQLKLRGHRVEPGEIEAVIARLDGVADAVVVPVAGERSADARLVAFVRGQDGCDLSGLRRAAAAELPVYMVPAAFLPVLGDFPRNPNGKIDRQALGRLAVESQSRKAS